MKALTAKKMIDACYTAKRARDFLPALPKGVAASYIRYLDVITEFSGKGERVKVSDISDRLGVKRPVITRTINEMERAGFVKKHRCDDDGRIVYLTATEEGCKLSERFNDNYFEKLLPLLEGITEKEAKTTIETIGKLYDAMSKANLSFK